MNKNIIAAMLALATVSSCAGAFASNITKTTAPVAKSKVTSKVQSRKLQTGNISSKKIKKVAKKPV